MHPFAKRSKKGVPYRHPKAVGPKPTSWKFGPVAPNTFSCSGAVWTPLLGFFGRFLYLDAFSSSAYDFLLSIFWIIHVI